MSQSVMVKLNNGTPVGKLKNGKRREWRDEREPAPEISHRMDGSGGARVRMRTLHGFQGERTV